MSKQAYVQWPERAQQRLLDLIAIQPLPEVAIAMRRSPGSIRSMLYRLGASTRMGQDWFTKYTLAEALHIRAEEVQRWISLGWLKCRLVQTGKLQREIIDADDFSEFCKGHSREVVGTKAEYRPAEFCQRLRVSSKPCGSLASQGEQEGKGGVRRTDGQVATIRD